MIYNVFGSTTKEAVLRETWGHLDIKPGQKHYGYFVFALSEYGDLVILADRFDDVESSPWWYEATHDFLWGLCEMNELNLSSRNIYRWVGQAEKAKNGKYLFTKGEISLLMSF